MPTFVNDRVVKENPYYMTDSVPGTVLGTQSPPETPLNLRNIEGGAESQSGSEQNTF